MESPWGRGERRAGSVSVLLPVTVPDKLLPYLHAREHRKKKNQNSVSWLHAVFITDIKMY